MKVRSTVSPGAVEKFSGFGPLPLADSGPGVFLVCLGVLGSGGDAWGEVLQGNREILTSLYFWPHEELCISNYQPHKELCISN